MNLERLSFRAFEALDKPVQIFVYVAIVVFACLFGRSMH